MSDTLLNVDTNIPPPPAPALCSKPSTPGGRRNTISYRIDGRLEGAPATPTVVKTNRAQANSESELTFKPKIISLPTSIYGNAGTPRNNGNYGHHSTANPNTTPTFTAGMYNLSFEERAIRASRDKAVKIAMSKEINEKALLKECTHVPKINKNSERAAMMKKKDSRSVAERLYDERIVLERRQKLRMEEKALEDKRKLMEENTFQPQLKTRGKDGKGEKLSDAKGGGSAP